MRDREQEIASSDFKRHKKMPVFARIAIGFVWGALIGFVWYRTVGCSGGTCPITAHPWTSMAYGGVMGALIASGK